MKAQLEDEILKASECLGDYLKSKSSSESKRSQCFKTDILCEFPGEIGKERQFVDVVIKEEGDKQNLNSILKEDMTYESHVNAHAQLSESVYFQLIEKDESRENLAYDDGQNQGKKKEDIKNSDVVLEEAEKKGVGLFLSP